MNFDLDDDQEAFRREVRAFATRKLVPHYQADDKAAKLRPEVLGDIAGMGLMGLRIPEEYGGQGAGAFVTGIACEEVARADFNSGYLVLNAALISEIVGANGNDDQKAAWLGPIAAGDVLPALVLTEPEHGSDAAHLQLKAVRDGSGWRLEGEKTSISLGLHAHAGVVFARTGGDGARGVSAFYVHFDDRYLSRKGFSDLGNRSIGRASLHFDGHPVPSEALIGGEGLGFVQCMQGFDYSRALIGLMCLGAAQASIDEALAYAQERTAFGQPIGRFQGLSFPLVEYATYLKGARHICYEALWRKDEGLDHTVEANMAKWWAPKVAMEAAHQALLTFGHVGYSDEVPLGQRLRDIIGLEIGDGTAQIAKLVVARQLLGRASAP